MGKFHVTIKTKFGEISIDGDSSKEILELVNEALNLGESVEAAIPKEKLMSPTLAKPAQSIIAKKELEGIIEESTDGKPQITIAPEKLTAKDVIGLLLYWKYPEGLAVGELKELVSLSWKAVEQPYIAANIGQMKGLILREGSRGAYIYKLSGTGKSSIENTLLPKLRGEENE